MFGEWDSLCDAIALSLKGDHHERAAYLFEAAQERPDWKYMFALFVNGFFADTLPGRTTCHSSDSLPFTDKNSAKSIPPFSKLFSEYYCGFEIST